MYKKKILSGICTCGHPWDEHHLSVVMSMDYFLATDEQYVPEECESCNDCETYKDKEE